MINNNNRQNGRRRGRGGPRPQGNPGQPGGGNRIDNRARGNAQQLHEKYRNLARDSQLAGDRVTTEYYLQFADHYFRVLSESRARFDEQRPQRADPDEDFEGGDEFDARDNRDQRDNRDTRETRDNRDQGQRRDTRQDRDYRQDRDDRAPEAVETPVEADSFDSQANDNPRRGRGNPRRRREEGVTEGGEQAEGFDADRLPPAIAVGNEEPSEDAPAPRRRGRRPRAEAANDLEVPPAA